jgi:hypothetical protein
MRHQDTSPGPTPTADTKLQVLADHYKDSCGILQGYRKHRDYLFSLMLLVLALILVEVLSPELSAALTSDFLKKKLELTTQIDLSFIWSILWFGLLALVVRYGQTMVHMERHYTYLHGLEDSLHEHCGPAAFTREGKAYLDKYPLFLAWADLLYKIIFPLLLLAVVVLKTIYEIRGPHHWPILLFNIAVAACIVISTILYLLMIHWRK